MTNDPYSEIKQLGEFMSDSNFRPSPLQSVTEIGRQLEFRGFREIETLMSGGVDKVPSQPGVYLILDNSRSPPDFVSRGTGGHFKGQDPNVSIERLKSKWVQNAPIVYVGSSGRSGGSEANLKKRIDTLIRFGRGEDVPHRGGRFVWQLSDAEKLLVCWKEINKFRPDEPEEYKKKIISQFKHVYEGRLPFANLKD